MAAETESLLADLQAMYGELHPYRNPAAMRVDDATLALGVLIRRELASLIGVSNSHEDGAKLRDFLLGVSKSGVKHTLKKLPPGPRTLFGPTARPRGKGKSPE